MNLFKRFTVWLALLCALNLNAQTPFTFAVLADVQYGDKDPWKVRHYRESLSRLDECVADLNRRNPAFVIQLGDLIDGYPADPVRSAQDLDTVLSVYNRLTMPRYHTVGNHCIRAGRTVLGQKLGLEKFYYDFTLPGAAGWRFVVLDGMNAGEGLLGDEQTKWLCALLKQSAGRQEKVICFCHFPLAGKSALTNAQEVLRSAAETGCMAAWFAGHAHGGGYLLTNGIHQVTVRGMVEASARNAYALVEIHPDRLRETGIGEEPSRELPFIKPAE
ncbi:MAG TPA: metallophosphoesterase [Pontiellaceae bacterium]|nr:metallophosphoesterase [Pontiellaceae bacterium]